LEDKSIPGKTTIHKILKNSGFKMLNLLKKTLIWPRNQLRRLEFCKEMVEKGPVFWESVIWSDETTVRQRPQGKKMEFRVHSSANKEDLPVNAQVHSGGFSVMFWGCFSKVGLGPLVALEGNMTGEKYIELLKTTLIPELAAAGRPMTFMQDNAPCHTANLVKAFMAENDIETLPWPAQSPDMNPIENLWAIIKARRQKKFGFPKSKSDLIEQIFDIWDNIDPKLVEKLADSANKRVNAVLKLKGKVSKY
jgi:transposase